MAPENAVPTQRTDASPKKEILNDKKVNQTASLSLQGCVTKGQRESQREEWESEWAWAGNLFQSPET